MFVVAVFTIKLENSSHKKKKYCGWEYGKSVLASEPHLFFDVSVVILPDPGCQ